MCHLCYKCELTHVLKILCISCYYIMAMRYRCKNKTCSKTLNGYDSQILRQLPLRLQAEFPAYFTHKSAVSKKVGDLLRICMQNATGPQRFAKILREIHKMRHHKS